MSTEIKEFSHMREVSDISVYPNPANNNITIKISETISSMVTSINWSVNIFDISGKKKDELTFSINQQDIQIDVSSYNNGIYIVVFQNDNKILAQEKFIITN